MTHHCHESSIAQLVEAMLSKRVFAGLNLTRSDPFFNYPTGPEADPGYITRNSGH